MEEHQGKRRGRPRKVVAEHPAVADGSGAVEWSDPDGQGSESDAGAACEASPVGSWGEAVERLNAVPDSVILTKVTVPFAGHPEIYSRLQYGAVVVAGDEFSGVCADGKIINL